LLPSSFSPLRCTMNMGTPAHRGGEPGRQGSKGSQQSESMSSWAPCCHPSMPTSAVSALVAHNSTHTGTLQTPDEAAAAAWLLLAQAHSAGLTGRTHQQARMSGHRVSLTGAILAGHKLLQGVTVWSHNTAGSERQIHQRDNNRGDGPPLLPASKPPPTTGLSPPAPPL